MLPTCYLREGRNVILPGQVFDGQAGLHQNGHRDFDPAVGRYIESDPLGLRAGINTYDYTEDNPINNYDAKGLETSSIGEVVGQFSAVGLSAAWQAYADAQAALQAAIDAVIDHDISGGPESLHNGPADAFRHCTWSCLMTRSIGAQKAAAVGATHEFYNLRDDNESLNEFLMDTANNAVGRCVGKSSKKPCTTACMDKLRSGDLYA